jgi:hypothetical protein
MNNWKSIVGLAVLLLLAGCSQAVQENSAQGETATPPVKTAAVQSANAEPPTASNQQPTTSNQSPAPSPQPPTPVPELLAPPPLLREEVDVDPTELVAVVSQDSIEAILEPELVPVEEARGMIGFEDVIGVCLGEACHAYPIIMLSSHEIVNDEIGGVPVAITWCPLCYSGLAFDRRVGEETLTFGVSGKLLYNVLVMFDHQTDSLWSQLLGQGVDGEMRGVRLRQVPATQTTWAQWLALHPDTLVLSKFGGPLAGLYFDDPFRQYYYSDQVGVELPLPVSVDELDPKAKVVAVRSGGLAAAYPISLLSRNPVVNDVIGEEPVLVVFDSESGAGLVFERRFGGQTLSFVRDEAAEDELILVDEETGSRWQALSGEAIDGPLAKEGARLERLPSTYSYWFGWKSHFPDTALYLPE